MAEKKIEDNSSKDTKENKKQSDHNDFFIKEKQQWQRFVGLLKL